ncbi:MAG: carboxypeptidase-like regulatory domain-containing protein [Bacteroidia bacterium]
MKKIIAIIIFTFLIALGLSANTNPDKTKMVSGKVMDKQSGETLAGVKLQVKGTTTFCYTDMDGNFTLQVNAVSITEVQVDFVGYEQTTLKTNQLSIGSDIVLNPR